MLASSRSFSTMASLERVYIVIRIIYILYLLSAGLLSNTAHARRPAIYNRNWILRPNETDTKPTVALNQDDSQSGDTLGSCWSRVDARGHCFELILENITRAECCALATREGYSGSGWFDQAILTSRQYFNWVLVQKHGPVCQPCRASCTDVYCGANKVCKIRGTKAQCVCSIPGCSGPQRRETRRNGQVCGFDGKTYKNKCSMLKKYCKKNSDAPHIDYYGKCQCMYDNSCDKIRCQQNQSCVLDQNSVPHCIECDLSPCSNSTSASERVCGGNGKTYSSLCHLERETCRLGKAIKVAYPGPCKGGLTCHDLQCENSDDRCLRDLRTGIPQCYPCTHSCPQGQSRQPLCGTDGKTYYGWCRMVAAACHKGIVIETEHYGKCKHGE